MRKLETFLRKRVILAYTLFYTLVFILINITFVWLNVRYIDATIDDQNSSLIEMMEHLIEERDEATALLFLEHYGHTHSVYLRYEGLISQDSYETYEAPTQYDTYTIYAHNTTYAVLHIDNVQSTLIQTNTRFIVSFNVIFFAVFLTGLFVLQLYIRHQTTRIIDDMGQLKKHIQNLKTREAYYFDDFEMIDQAFEEKITAIESLKKAHTKKIRTLTHDIKTPLTILKTMLEGLEQERLSLNSETLSSMLEEIDVMNDLIPRIIETPEPKLIKKHNAKTMISDYLNKITPLFESRSIAFDVSLEDAHLDIEAGDFIRILDHLLMNVYHHASDTKTVHLDLRADPLTFTLKDEGPAIKSRIIEALNRDLPSSKSSKQGTGIGLFVVRDIVSEYGGTLTIDTTQHHNIITITFPS